MTVQEAKAEIPALEELIRKATIAFEKRTGLKVKSIDVWKERAGTDDDPFAMSPTITVDAAL